MAKHVNVKDVQECYELQERLEKVEEGLNSEYTATLVAGGEIRKLIERVSKLEKRLDVFGTSFNNNNENTAEILVDQGNSIGSTRACIDILQRQIDGLKEQVEDLPRSREIGESIGLLFHTLAARARKRRRKPAANVVTHKHWTEKETAEILGVPRETLRTWRKRGAGPPFLRIEKGGTIRYNPLKVIDWMEAATVYPHVKD